MINRTNQRINYFRYLFRSKYQSKNSPYYFGYGRTALKVGLLSLNIPSGKIILVPNYICKEAIEPFLELNIEVVYYPVNKDLSPDWISVNDLLNNQVFAILMVHYFGIPQNIEYFLNFADINNLLLIEDNSHGFLGCYNNKLLGTFGHIGISSPRKSLPILNGGVLYLRNDFLIGERDFVLEDVNVKKMILKDFIGRLLDISPLIKNKVLNQSKINVIEENRLNDWAIDTASFNILNEFNKEEVCKHRTKIYSILEKWSLSVGLTPLRTLNNEFCAPISMPLIFKEMRERDKWMTIFRKNDIAAYLWPDLPQEIINGNNSGQNLRDTVLCLPIHLSIIPEKLEGYLYNKFKI